MKTWKTAARALLLGASIGTQQAAGATGNPWFDDFVNYETANGTAYTGNPDAGLLAWQESMMLRSYLNLYAATKDTSWLTKFTTHVGPTLSPSAGTVMYSLNNYDGDAYRDWTSARYSPPIVTNGLFKTGDTGDSTLPSGWTRHGATSSSTAFRVSGPGEYLSSCNGDTWGFKLVTDGVSLQRLYQQLTYQPGWRYQLSIYAKNTGTAVHGRAYVLDHATGEEIAAVEVNSQNWANYKVDFTMPASGVVRIWLAHNAYAPAGAGTYFDNVRVAPHYAYQVLDGMIGVPLANFVRLVDRTPSLQTAFGGAAADYQLFLEDELIPKWQDSAGFYGNTWVDASATEGYYKEPTTHNTFESGTVFDPLPYNQSFALLEVQDILYDVNSISAYRTRAEKSARHFVNRLTVPPNEFAYTWYYGAFVNPKVEDTSHSNVDLEFVTAMHRPGGVFTDLDLDRFTATLTDNLWNGSLTAPKLANHVNGAPGNYCSPDGFSRIMYGWVPCAQFDPLVWTIAAKQYAIAGAGNHTEALTLSQIILWDPVKLTNQGFELPASGDPTLPARWSRFQSSNATAFRDPANKSTGDWGLTLVSSPPYWQKLTQPWTDYVASTSYTVTFDGKVDASGANGRVWIYNEDTGSTIASYNFSNTSGWQTHSFTFTSPSSATTNVKIQLGHQNPQVNGGHAYFDNVSIRRTIDAW